MSAFEESYDSLLQHIGGFGRYQLVLCIFGMMVNLATNWILYGMMFYTLFPKYECNNGGQWTTCT